MKIKIGSKIYDSIQQPIMVILTDSDKENIRNMLAKCTKYATFPEGWGSTEEMYSWMSKE